MKLIIIIFLILFSVSTFGQSKKVRKQTQAIVKEGKALYKSEMASWYGTDLFLEKFTDREKIGGYFSYSEENTSKSLLQQIFVPSCFIKNIQVGNNICFFRPNMYRSGIVKKNLW